MHVCLELADAGSLQDVIELHGRVPELETAAAIAQVVIGLHHLHTKIHYLHCDLKPANLLLTDLGVVKIADLGLSHSLSSDATGQGGYGTTLFMAPELFEEGVAPQQASEVWALALCACTALEGRHPLLHHPDVQSNNFFSIRSLLIDPKTDLLPPHGPPLSEAARDVLSQCLEREPRLRPTIEALHWYDWLKSHVTDVPNAQARLASWLKAQPTPQEKAPSAGSSEEGGLSLHMLSNSSVEG